MEPTPNQARDDLLRWLEQFDLDRPLLDYIGDPALLEPISFEPEELRELEALGLAYVQELNEQGLLPDFPQVQNKGEPKRQPEKGFDLSR